MKKHLFRILLSAAAVFFLAALGLVCAAVYKGVFAAPAGAFDAQGRPLVLLFTGKSCDATCALAAKELKARNAVFQEVDIDRDAAGRQRFERLGGEAVPYLVAGGTRLPRPNHAEIASALAQLHGDQALTPQERGYYRNHFAADGCPLIYIYGASWCKDCRRLAERLTARSIPFIEIDVEQAPDMDTMMSTLHITYYPTTYVGYDRVPDSESVLEILQALQTTARRKLDTPAARRDQS